VWALRTILKVRVTNHSRGDSEGMGGIGGVPEFLLSPAPRLIGVITNHGYMKFADLELLRIAVFESVNVKGATSPREEPPPTE
jgi:hypothetical protein